jgi:integrase/recombinase XerC/integrase/recombinase XerD
MRRTAGESPNSKIGQSDAQITVSELREYVKDWFIDATINGHTAQSIKSRRARIEKFFWFLDYRSYTTVGTAELRDFVLYLQTAHESVEGRWCNPSLRTPMRPIMVRNYHCIVKAFFNFLIQEELIDFDPMKRVKIANPKTEIKQPVSNGDILKLLGAAKGSSSRRRDEAIILTLLDSGMRASELCGLKQRDLDEENLSLRVVGKGNKIRTVRISTKTYKALRAYLRMEGRDEGAPLFRSPKGALKASGLYQIMKRLSHRAGIPNQGCHALRRSFAVNMLRNGANAFSVQILMGHADLTMTRRYCCIAEADISEQHRQHSPVEMLKI